MAFVKEVYYDTDDDAYASIYGSTWRGQTITTVGGFDLTRVSLLLWRGQTPGDITLGLYATSSGLPTGAALATKTIDSSSITTNQVGEWIDFDLDSALTLSATTMYAVILSAPDGSISNYISWRRDESSPAYAGGGVVVSTNSGSSWTGATTADYMFQLYSGEADPVYVDMEGSSSIIFALTGDITSALDLTGTAALVFTVSAALLSFGPLSAVKAEKYTRRLVACANDEFWYEE
jgi:hypothetical protein